MWQLSRVSLLSPIRDMPAFPREFHVFTTSPETSEASRPPLRVRFGHMDDAVRDHVTALVARYPRRVQVLQDPGARADLVLVDPYVEGGFDADRVSQRAVGDAPIVIYTPRAQVDHLAFAMAGAALDGRLRGWISAGLGAIALVGALELIQSGTVVLHGRGRPLTV